MRKKFSRCFSGFWSCLHKNNFVSKYETEIPRQFASRLKLKVRDKEPERDWEYVIYWIDANGVIHRHDPKIAIKSSRTTFAHSHHQSSLKPWLALVLGLLGIALWLTDDKKKDS